MKSGNLNFLEPSGQLQVCNGTALPLPASVVKRSTLFAKWVAVSNKNIHTPTQTRQLCHNTCTYANHRHGARGFATVWKSPRNSALSWDRILYHNLKKKPLRGAILQSVEPRHFSNSLRSSLTLILPRSRTGTVWFYTSTSNKRAARPKVYTKSLTRDLKLMYSRLTLVRISIKL